MRNVILGAAAGLLVGSAGALAYSHFAGDGGLAALQAQLDDANAKLKQAEADKKFLKEQNNSEAEQLNQVLASKQQTQDSGDKGATPAPAAPTPMTIGGMLVTPDMVRGFLSRGGGPGFRSPEQRMFLLQTRLKLDPDQAKAIKASMDADNQARREAFRQARQNGTPPDPQALAAANTLDKTLASVLSPAQQAQYQQVRNDEKQAQAETSATMQVDNLMPLLQLSDDQKEKMMTALYQQQISGGDGASMANNPNPLGALAQQGQSIQTTMKQVLSPDQFAIYQQSDQMQQQGFGNFGGRNRGNNNGGNGGGQNNGNGGGGQIAAAVPGATPSGSVVATSTTTGILANGSTASTTNYAYVPSGASAPAAADGSASTNAASTTTNAPSATTNAANANVTPPAPAN